MKKNLARLAAASIVAAGLSFAAPAPHAAACRPSMSSPSAVAYCDAYYENRAPLWVKKCKPGKGRAAMHRSARAKAVQCVRSGRASR